MSEITQTGNTVTNGDLIAGNKITNYHFKETKLKSLFRKLNECYNQDKKIDSICDDLKRYLTDRDTIGLEQKLIEGGKAHLYENAEWLKHEYAKKLTKFQFFEHAQHIHAFILGVVLCNFTNSVYPLILKGEGEPIIMRAIQTEIIDPLINLIVDEGCEDVMGLSSTEINGMVYFLTGRCHIKWN